MIEYKNHNQIDRKRWDACIEESVNRLPYALSWWLDAVCPDWEALVQGDYRAVMPLTRGRKFGFDYLYQPYFTQQLGVFFGETGDAGMVKQFLDAIPDKYRYIQVQFNMHNIIGQSDFSVTPRKNYLIDLTPSALFLAGNYHRNCRRNIQKAIHKGLKVKPGPGPALFIRFIRQNLDMQLSGTRKSFYPALYRIITASIQNSSGEILGIYNRSGKLVAAGWFITTLGRCLFQVCASTRGGKEKQAMFLLVDHMIRKMAGSGLVFDFAGSNSSGIAYFNAGFGAKETFYPALHRNKLPWLLRFLKR
jgi:hypothetical protein